MQLTKRMRAHVRASHMTGIGSGLRSGERRGRVQHGGQVDRPRRDWTASERRSVPGSVTHAGMHGVWTSPGWSGTMGVRAEGDQSVVRSLRRAASGFVWIASETRQSTGTTAYSVVKSYMRSRGVSRAIGGGRLARDADVRAVRPIRRLAEHTQSTYAIAGPIDLHSSPGSAGRGFRGAGSRPARRPKSPAFRRLQVTKRSGTRAAMAACQPPPTATAVAATGRGVQARCGRCAFKASSHVVHR